LVKTVCKILVRREDIESFKAAAREGVRAFREEPGNGSYTLNEEIGSDSKFALIALWNDAGAAQRHCDSREFEDFRMKMAPMCLRVEDVKTMEYDESRARADGKHGDNLTVLMPGVSILLDKGREMEIYQELRC